MSTAVSVEAKRLLRRIQAEAAPLKIVLQAEEAAAQTYREFARRHQTETREMPRAQKLLGSGRHHGGASPFPWFVNVGHGWYLASITVCLFHCTEPQRHLAGMERSSMLREALQDLLSEYTSGIVLPGGAAPWHWS